MSDQPPTSQDPPLSPEWREWPGGYSQPGYSPLYGGAPSQPPNYLPPPQTGYPPVVAYPVYSAPMEPAEIGNRFAAVGLVFAIISLVAFLVGVLYIFLTMTEGYNSLFCGLVSSILGIVLSARGRHSAKRKAMATVGLILSIVVLVLLLLFVALSIVAR